MATTDHMVPLESTTTVDGAAGNRLMKRQGFKKTQM